MDALASADAAVGSLSTKCSLCEKSCLRGSSGIDARALLHAHWHQHHVYATGKIVRRELKRRDAEKREGKTP